MTLVRFQPCFDDFQTFHNRFNRIFSDMGGHPVVSDDPLRAWSPLCDIQEDSDQIVVKADLPGVDLDDLDIEVEKNVLVIRGERKREKEVKSENLYQTERFHGSFSRSFKLPATVNNEKIRAEYRDGVLSITLPKLEAAKPLKIKVLNE